MKAIIYARVSSDEQQREGFSIPAQIELLQNYAKKNNIEVVKIYEEAQTAKQSGRMKHIQHQLEHTTIKTGICRTCSQR